MKLGLPGYFYSFGCNFCLLSDVCSHRGLEMTPESVIVARRKGAACVSQLIYSNREVVRQLLCFPPN